MLIIGVAVCLAIIYSYCEAEVSQYDPIYVILKEPLLVLVDNDTAMVYKIRVHNLELGYAGCPGLVRFGLYHEKARQILGTYLIIPIEGIRCIVVGETKIKGSMWE
jgi:hypothetical protein